MKEKHREPEVPEERVPVVECFDGHARITSEELAPIHSVKNGTLQNFCSTSPKKDAGLGKSALVHRQVEEQPSKRYKNNGDKSAVAMLKITRQLGLRTSRYGTAEVFIDFAEELKHSEANPMCSIHQSRRTSC